MQRTPTCPTSANPEDTFLHRHLCSWSFPIPSSISHLQGKGGPDPSSSVMFFGLASGLQIHDGTQPPGLGIVLFSYNILKLMSVQLLPHLTRTTRNRGSERFIALSEALWLCIASTLCLEPRFLDSHPVLVPLLP